MLHEEHERLGKIETRKHNCVKFLLPQTFRSANHAFNREGIKKAFEAIQLRSFPQYTEMPELHADLVVCQIHLLERCEDFAHDFPRLCFNKIHDRRSLRSYDQEETLAD